MSLKYCCNLVLTAEQSEEDSVHGIYENEQRIIQLIPETNSFVFTYHYFYEYENSSYAIVRSTKNDTEFKGNYQKQGNKIVAVIAGGKQDAQDLVTKKTLFQGGDIAGRIELLEDGGVLKVEVADLQPANLDRKDRLVAANQVFK